jgi:hypothetical protein
VPEKEGIDVGFNGSGMKYDVIVWVVEMSVDLQEDCLQNMGEAFGRLDGNFSERRGMTFGGDPGFKRGAGSEGVERHEFVTFKDDSLFSLTFLLNQIAKDAPVRVLVIFSCYSTDMTDMPWNDRCAYDLRMRMDE